jgi:hypothetical protein
MRKWVLATAIGLALSLGVWFSLAASASSPRGPARAPAKSQLTATTATQANGSAKVVGTKANPAVKAMPKVAKLSAKSSSSASENGNESGSESESEKPSDEGDGYEDPPGDVNHECPPDCGPGEKP